MKYKITNKILKERIYRVSDDVAKELSDWFDDLLKNNPKQLTDLVQSLISWDPTGDVAAWLDYTPLDGDWFDDNFDNATDAAVAMAYSDTEKFLSNWGASNSFARRLKDKWGIETISESELFEKYKAEKDTILNEIIDLVYDEEISEVRYFRQNPTIRDRFIEIIK